MVATVERYVWPFTVTFTGGFLPLPSASTTPAGTTIPAVFLFFPQSIFATNVWAMGLPPPAIPRLSTSKLFVGRVYSRRDLLLFDDARQQFPQYAHFPFVQRRE